MFVETELRVFGSPSGYGERLPLTNRHYGFEDRDEASLALGALGTRLEDPRNEDGTLYRFWQPKDRGKAVPVYYSAEQVENFKSTLLEQKDQSMRFSLEGNSFKLPMLTTLHSQILRDLVEDVSCRSPEVYAFVKPDDDVLALSSASAFPGAKLLRARIDQGEEIGQKTVEKIFAKKFPKRVRLPRGVIGYERVEAGVGSRYPKVTSVTVATSLLD